MDIHYSTHGGFVQGIPDSSHGTSRAGNGVHRKHDGTGKITISGPKAETDRLWSALTLLLEVGTDIGREGKASDLEALVEHGKALSGPPTLTAADLSMMPEGAEVQAYVFDDAGHRRGERCVWRRLESGRWMPASGRVSVDDNPEVSSRWLAGARRPTAVTP